MPMPQERWAPSWGLRLLAGIEVICYLGLGWVLMWFFFPHVLLVPALAVHAGALALRIVYGATGVAVVLIGVVLLYRAWHNRRVAGQPG